MRAILTTVFLGAVLSACFAQESQMPPRPAELDRLEFMIGEFDQVDTATLPTGEKVETKSKATAKWTLGKRYIRSEYDGEMPGMGKFEGMLMLTWNELIGKYEGTWFDSMGGWHIKASGMLENDTLTLTSEEVEIPQMGKMQFRMIYKKLDAKRIEFKLDMKMGTPDFMNQMTSMMTRKG